VYECWCVVQALVADDRGVVGACAGARARCGVPFKVMAIPARKS